MSLYPSLEDMKVDHMAKAQEHLVANMKAAGMTNSAPSAAAPSGLPYPAAHPAAAAPVYPGLASFMGMELTEDVIRANMPEYLQGDGRGGGHNSQLVRTTVNLAWCGC